MADNLYPNPLTIGPDGDVQAQGIDLPAAPLQAYPPGAVNAVRWLRTADGAVVAEIDATDQGNTSSEPYFRDTVRPANLGPLGNGATREIGVYDHNSNPVLRLLLNLVNDGYGSGQPNADDRFEIQHRQNAPLVVYRASDGASNFLQLGTALRSAVVTGQLTWAGGSAFSETLVIPLAGAGDDVYGLFTPGGNVLSPTGGFIDSGAITTFAPGNAGLQIQGRTIGSEQPPAGSTMTCTGLIWG